MDFSEDEAERLSLHAGDLLVCEGGEVGRTAIWQGEIQGCSYQNHVHRLRRKDVDCVPEFVMYWMQAGFLQLGLYGGTANRTTIPNLSGARLKQLPIPLPPAEEQRGIAGILSAIQAAMEVQERIVATLKELKAATMAKLFREGAIRGLMFDTNVFDDLVDGRLPVSDMPKGVPIFATHVQSDEIEGCPDAERRVQLQALVRNLSERIPTASFVLGVSRLDEARLGDGSMFGVLRGAAGRRTNDALIAETAVKERLVLVTNDRDLRTRVRAVGGEAIDTQELVSGKLRPMKQTEVGEIPESWGVVRFGDYCSISSGGTPSRDNPDYWNGNIPWVKTGEIDYRPIARTKEHITEAGLRNSSARIFPKGTLLMAMYGQGVTRGKVAFLEIDAATNQACAALFPRQGLDAGYLYSYCAFAYDRIREFGHGANQKNLSADLIREIGLPVPPTLEEQQGVYSAIKAVESRVQAAEQTRDRLKAVFTSVLGLLMTGQVRVRLAVGTACRGAGAEATSWLDKLPGNVERFVTELVRRFEPERVILFGSHAEGSATADSDVDLLVVMPFEGRGCDQAARMDCALERDFPLDLLVRRPEAVRESLERGDPFMKEIIEKGKVLYARPE